MSNPVQPSPGAPRAPVDSKVVPFEPLGDFSTVSAAAPPVPAKGTSDEPAIYDETDRLVMLTPCYGGLQTVLFRDSVHVAITQQPKALFRCADGKVRNLPILAMAINLPGDSHIDRARNNIIHDFLATPYRHALFCDGDQPFEPHDIALTWVRLMSGVRVIGGSVALKILKTTFACNTVGNTKTPGPDGLLPGRDTGTGWLGFKRDVLDEMSTRWPQYVRERLARAINYRPDDALVDRALAAMAHCGYSADISYKANVGTPHAGETLHAFFASGVTFRDGTGDWLSEDWMFCHRCLQLGIEIKIDPMIRIKHLGAMLFPPEPDDLVAAALQVTGGKNPPFNPRLAAEAHAVLQRLIADQGDQSITILHATRGRPEQALATRQLWHERASAGAKFEYIFAVDQDDATAPKLLAELSEMRATDGVVTCEPGGGIVKAINAAAAKATGRILIMAADDCEPPPGWDQLIRAALAGQLHAPRLLWTSDGYTDQPVITHPIMTRALYEANGGWFFCPEYPHLFCDTELTQRAIAAHQVIDARHIVLKHQHPMFTKAAPDALHLARNSKEAWSTGAAIFQKRNPGVKHPHVEASP